MLCAFICFFVFCVILQVQVSAQATDTESSPSPAAAEVMPTPIANKRADRILKQAYRDTFRLLSESNDCSRFYGGSRIAITVLNEFFAKLRKRRLPENVSFTMAGKSVYVFNVEAKVRFRLFDEILLNERGSFYMRFGPMGTRVRNMGSFLPASRSARALTLLHELGHLIRSPSGQWLLQDDGNNFEKSRRNTEMVEQACREELRMLK
jgi:hypothetical protein